MCALFLGIIYAVIKESADYRHISVRLTTSP